MGAYPGGVPPGLSPVHLLVIFVVALVVLGPEKGPEAIGKGARLLGEARQWIARTAEELQSAVSLPTEEPAAAPTKTPTAPPGADAGDAKAPGQPPAEGAAPPRVEPVSDAAAPADAIPSSSPPGPAAADRPPVQEERHL